MLYLIIGFFCSAAISIVLKIGERKPYNRYAMLMFNYLTCVIVEIIFLPSKEIPFASEGFKFATMLGAINGCMYLASMVMNQINVNKNGAILQSTFARLGVMIPTVFSIIFFGERPSFIQYIGITLVIGVILLMFYGNQAKESEELRKESATTKKPVIILLLMCLLFGGISDFMSKVFQQYGFRELDGWFIICTFSFALLLCFLIVIVTKSKFGVREAIFGVCLGVPNLLSTKFLLKALNSVEAYMAYPIYSVGAILVVMLASMFFFGEKLDKWSKISVILIICAIVCLNL